MAIKRTYFAVISDIPDFETAYKESIREISPEELERAKVQARDRVEQLGVDVDAIFDGEDSDSESDGGRSDQLLQPAEHTGNATH